MCYETNQKRSQRGEDSGLALGCKAAKGSWQVEAENRPGQLMPEEFERWEDLTSFPFVDHNSTNKQKMRK